MSTILKKAIIMVWAVGGSLLIACNNPQSKTTESQDQQKKDSKNVYACPMHPKETGKQGEKCKICGMALELTAKSVTENLDVKITTPSKIEPGKPSQLIFSVTKNGKIAVLDVVHEKKIHVFLVNEALTWFDHFHTEETVNGKYTANETFPFSGKYFIYTDFKASGSSATVNKQEINVAGNDTDKTKTATNKWVSKVKDYTVTLENGNDFKSNRPQQLNISIEKKGKFLSGKDIQPYLGAIAHIILVDTADKNFLHVHPASNERFPIQGETYFEKPGAYRMWVQFQVDGKVLTADFSINLTKGDKLSEREPNNHSEHSH